DSIDYPTSEGDNDDNDDGDDLSEDDANDEDEEESSDSEQEEEEHIAPTVPAPAQYSFVSESDETEPFEEGKTAATPPPFGYHIAARISVQPHILMPFRTESEVERLLAIPNPPLSLVSLTSYTLPQLLIPLPIYTPLATSSFSLPSSIPSTSGSESIPEADIPLQKRARFTTPTSRYEIGESSVAAAARQIRPTLTIAESRRADVKLIGRLRERGDIFAPWLLLMHRRLLTLVIIVLGSWTIASHERSIRKMAPKRRTTRLNPSITPVTAPSTTTTSVTNGQLQAMINEGVNAALAARDATWNGDDSHTSGTYDALTWWNSYVKTTTPEEAYAMTWATLKKKMTGKYCPRGEIKKIETKMWNLKVKGNYVVAYNRRF
nr:reverse transcriptase domain-containing protein [Tanacetum cinerariifolium]